ncbi:MAG: ATP synthase F1 subunit epsilon [Ruminococcus sp.]|nr:ATP synthase F1 subunit epsilon [Ruminococcus sp.]
MTPYNIKVLTPEKIFYEGSTEQIIAKTASGNVGILAGHSPYVANLVASELRIKIDGSFRSAAVSDGIIKVSVDGTVTILSSAIEWSDEIDVARAEKAKAYAESKMKEHASQKEFDLAEQKLKRALNRLVVAQKR